MDTTVATILVPIVAFDDRDPQHVVERMAENATALVAGDLVACSLYEPFVPDAQALLTGAEHHVVSTEANLMNAQASMDEAALAGDYARAQRVKTNRDGLERKLARVRQELRTFSESGAYLDTVVAERVARAHLPTAPSLTIETVYDGYVE